VIRRYNPPLQVVQFVGTTSSDTHRGPEVRVNAGEARLRMVTDGELVWVHGPRRQELAPVRIDDSLPRGAAVVQDISGVTVSEIIRIVKPDLDRDPRAQFA
jgi:anaerobic selenocysteine-containing dehydrogenase